MSPSSKAVTTTDDADSAIMLEDGLVGEISLLVPVLKKQQQQQLQGEEEEEQGGVKVIRSISDVVKAREQQQQQQQQPKRSSIGIKTKEERRASNRQKLLTIAKRHSGFLKRPEILETVYSVEEDPTADQQQQQQQLQQQQQEEEKEKSEAAPLAKEETMSEDEQVRLKYVSYTEFLNFLTYVLMNLKIYEQTLLKCPLLSYYGRHFTHILPLRQGFFLKKNMFELWSKLASSPLLPPSPPPPISLPLPPPPPSTRATGPWRKWRCQWHHNSSSSSSSSNTSSTTTSSPPRSGTGWTPPPPHRREEGPPRTTPQTRIQPGTAGGRLVCDRLNFSQSKKVNFRLIH